MTNTNTSTSRDYGFGLIPTPPQPRPLLPPPSRPVLDERLLTIHLVEAAEMLNPQHEELPYFSPSASLKENRLCISTERNFHPRDPGYDLVWRWLTADPRTTADTYALALDRTIEHEDAAYFLTINCFYTDEDKQALRDAGLIQQRHQTAWNAETLVCTTGA